MANFWEESFYTKFNSDISLTKRMLNMSITIFVIFKIKINSRSENLNQYAAVHIAQLILHVFNSKHKYSICFILTTKVADNTVKVIGQTS